jgi:hypothetical protein
MCDLLSVEGTQNQGGAEIIEVTVDSGASENVLSPLHAKGCRTVPSAGSISGVQYISASLGVMDNMVEKHVRVETSEGHTCTMNMQVADVQKALMSVSKICDAGHHVVFTKTGGKIVHLESGQEISFVRKNDVYKLPLKVVGDGSMSGFTRQGE